MALKLWFALIFSVLGAAVSADPSKMPLLPAGQYHSIEPGFNLDNPRFLRRAIAAYLDQATQAGMQVKPLELDWADVERRRGRYRLGEFEETLQAYARNGWRPLVFVRAVDSDDVTIPPYLKGRDEAVALTEVDISAPLIIERYNALMDQVVPMVRRYGGFAILVANEVDNFLTPNPHLTPQVLTFVNAVRAHIRSIDPNMAVGVALSNGFDHVDDEGGRIRPPLAHHKALVDASDIAVYNFYCNTIPVSQQRNAVRQRLQSRINAAKGKDIIIQELGCPSAGADHFSLEHQRNFFAQFYEAARGTPVRVAIVFQLVDWSQRTIEFYAEALQPVLQAEPAFRENPDLIFVYLDQLSSIGVVNASDGAPKPAWSEFIKALQQQ